MTSPSCARIARALLAALLVPCATCAAHEWWLEPARFALAAPETVVIGASAGMGFRGERKVYAAGRALRLVTVDGEGARDHAPDGVPGTTVYATLPAATFRDGAALVSLETGWSSIELPPSEFAGYVAEEGLESTPGVAEALAGAAPIRERYARCGRTWLRPGAGARRPSGLTLELVPEAERPAPGRPLPVRVLLRGQPLAGALLKAWRRDLGADGVPHPADTRDSVAVAWRGRTDRAGRARVPLDRPGEWLLSVVHLEPCEVPALAEFQSHWASLTLAVSADR